MQKLHGDNAGAEATDADLKYTWGIPLDIDTIACVASWIRGSSKLESLDNMYIYIYIHMYIYIYIYGYE